MTEIKKYQVKYEDNTGNGDTIEEYNTIEEAEQAIDEDFENTKEWFNGCGEYDYGELGNEYGNLTKEIWLIDGNEYARWIRMWEREE